MLLKSELTEIINCGHKKVVPLHAMEALWVTGGIASLIP
jgi:hypothetical protein